MAAKRAGKRDSARELAVAAARIARDANCEDVVVLDLRKISPVTDYFVICTGTSDRQMRATAGQIEEYGQSVNQGVWRAAGKDSAEWIVLDFVDVVVHLFDPPRRSYYDLELIWGGAAKVRWNRRSSAGPGSSGKEE
jgi:ribosome-associated protein